MLGEIERRPGPVGVVDREDGPRFEARPDRLQLEALPVEGAIAVVLEEIDRVVDRELAHRFQRADADLGPLAEGLRQNATVLLEAMQHLVQRQAEVWAKTLADGSRAVILFNRGPAETPISVMTWCRKPARELCCTRTNGNPARAWTAGCFASRKIFGSI